MQTIEIVTAALAGSPSDRHLSAANLIARALAETFPCADAGVGTVNGYYNG